MLWSNQSQNKLPFPIQKTASDESECQVFVENIKKILQANDKVNGSYIDQTKECSVK